MKRPKFSKVHLFALQHLMAFPFKQKQFLANISKQSYCIWIPHNKLLIPSSWE